MSNSSLHDEVFAALLALDAYNRNHNEGIRLDPDMNGLGHLSFLYEHLDQANSFYARAYSYDDQIFISYRGTDQFVPNPLSWTFGDPLTGWVLGGGLFGAAQGTLALDFYHAVRAMAGENAITLTGHSLGGGLAGFIGGVYGIEAVVFDSMPYIAAAQNLYEYVTIDYPFTPGEQADVDYWRELVYGNDTPVAPNFQNVSGYYVEGEFLAYARSDEHYGHHRIDPVADLGHLNLLHTHSQSLLTLLLYGEKQVSPQRDDWEAAKEYLVTALFDHHVAQAAGAQNIEGALKAGSKFADILRTTLSYSMLHDGVLHFGNSGIHALFDDANDLGRALSLPGATRNLQLSAQALAQSFTQYAGQLAIGKVEAAQGSDERAGVLTLSADETVLSVDFGQERWRAGMDGADSGSNPGREAVVDDNCNAIMRMVSALLDLAESVVCHLSFAPRGRQWIAACSRV